MARLIIEEAQEKRFHRITEPVTTIGRAETNSVRITDVKCGRCHCQVAEENGGYVLTDLASQNGTRVNELRVERKPLVSGDVIQIGETRITFEMDAPSRRLPAVEGPTAEVPAASPPTVVRTSLRRKGLARLGGRLRRKKPASQVESRASVEGAVRARSGLEESLQELVRLQGDDGLAEANQVFERFLTEGDSTLLRRAYQRMEKLERMAEIATALNSELDLQKLLDLIMDAVVELTGAERGFLVLVDKDRPERLEIEAARNFDRESLVNPAFQFSQTIARKVAATGQAILAADAQDLAEEMSSVSLADLKVRSLLCLPMRSRGAAIGVVYLDNRLHQGMFEEDDIGILETFGDQAAIAIENARLHRENKRINQLLKEKVRRQEVDLVEARETITEQRAQLQTKYRYDRIIGGSEPMRRIFLLLDKITDSNAPVFIHGESGTGKELVARAIHFNGPRREKRFVSENCAAISESLLESELFGYSRGAFTGADRDKKGLFEQADGGTLFLDEIGDMSSEMQKKLLRALQEGEIRPVGSKETVKVDVRIISASNQDLRALVAEGRFREDLFYRVNVFAVELPPLRERKEDVPLLVDHLLEKICAECATSRREIDREALRLLIDYDWPGNVRELENELKRAVALSERAIVPAILSEHIRRERGRRFNPALLEGRSLKDLVRDATSEVEREIVETVLESSGWKKSEAAQRLGISRPTLDAKIEALKIQFPQR